MRTVYDEALAGLDAQILYDAEVDEIMNFVQEAFEEEKQKVKNSLSVSAFTEFERILDADDFRDEIKEKLKNISVSRLKDFSRYLNMVEYDSIYDGDEGILGGFLNKAGKNWNFNGYAAYHALRRDFDSSARKYADKATEIALDALKKRMAMMAELRNETNNHEEGGNGHGCV